MGDDQAEEVDDWVPALADAPDDPGEAAALAERVLPTLDDYPPTPSKELKGPFTSLRRRCGARMFKALGWRAAGYTWAECAAICDYKDTSMRKARIYAKEYGIGHILAKSDRIIGLHRQVAMEATQATLDKVLDGKENISARDMAVIAGISLDKVAAFEGWKNGKGGEDSSFVAELRKIAENGSSVKLSLEVQPPPEGMPPPPDDFDVLDVTPEDGGQEQG